MSRRSLALIPVLALALIVGGWAVETAGSPPSAAQSSSPALAPVETAEESAAVHLGLVSVAGVEAEAEAQERARLEAIEAERLVAERAARASRPAIVVVPNVRPGCEGDWPIPAWIVQRESGCDYGAVNRTGCSGHSCVGAYQFDLRHWIAREDGGWGGCAHLGDWRVPENQDACAVQMSRGGTNLAPWGY